MNAKCNLILSALLMLIAMGANAQCKKSVAIFGDSYSTFENYLSCDTNAVWYFQGKQKKTDVTDVEQTWWHLLLKEKGWKLECNNSFSGSTICYTGYRKEDYQNRSFHNRLRYLGSPDIILVFGATNDCWATSPIGDYKYSDWTKTDLYSFRHGCHVRRSQKAVSECRHLFHHELRFDRDHHHLLSHHLQSLRHTDD